LLVIPRLERYDSLTERFWKPNLTSGFALWIRAAGTKTYPKSHYLLHFA